MKNIDVFIRVMKAPNNEVVIDPLWGETIPTPLINATPLINNVKELINQGYEVHVYADVYANNGVLVDTEVDVDSLYQLGGPDFIAGKNGTTLPSEVLPVIDDIRIRAVGNTVLADIDVPSYGSAVTVTSSTVELVNNVDGTVVETKNLADSVSFTGVTPGEYAINVKISYSIHGAGSTIESKSKSTVTITQAPTIGLVNATMNGNEIDVSLVYNMGVGAIFISRELILRSTKDLTQVKLINFTDDGNGGTQHITEKITGIVSGSYYVDARIVYDLDGTQSTINKTTSLTSPIVISEKPAINTIHQLLLSVDSINVNTDYSLGSEVIIDSQEIVLYQINGGNRTEYAREPLATSVVFTQLPVGEYLAVADIKYTDLTGSHELTLEPAGTLKVSKYPSISSLTATVNKNDEIIVDTDFSLGDGFSVPSYVLNIYDSTDTTKPISSQTLVPDAVITMPPGKYVIEASISYRINGVIQTPITYKTPTAVTIIERPVINNLDARRTGVNEISVTVDYTLGFEAKVNTGNSNVQLINDRTNSIVATQQLGNTVTFGSIPEGYYTVKANIEYSDYGTITNVIDYIKYNIAITNEPVINSVVPNLDGSGGIVVNTDYENITVDADDTLSLVIASGTEKGRVVATSLLSRRVTFLESQIETGYEYEFVATINYVDYNGISRPKTKTSDAVDRVSIVKLPSVSHLHLSIVDNTTGYDSVKVEATVDNGSTGKNPQIMLFKESTTTSDILVDTKTFTGTDLTFSTINSAGKYYAVVAVPYTSTVGGTVNNHTYNSAPSSDASFDGQSLTVIREPIIAGLTPQAVGGHVYVTPNVDFGDGITFVSGSLKLMDKITGLSVEQIDVVHNSRMMFGKTVVPNPPHTYYVEAELVYNGYTTSETVTKISSDVTILNTGSVVNNAYGNDMSIHNTPVTGNTPGGTPGTPDRGPDGGILWENVPVLKITATPVIADDQVSIDIDPDYIDQLDTVALTLYNAQGNVVSTVADVQTVTTTFTMPETDNYYIVLSGTYTNTSNIRSLIAVPGTTTIFTNGKIILPPVISVFNTVLNVHGLIAVNVTVNDPSNTVTRIIAMLRHSSGALIESIDIVNGAGIFTTVPADKTDYTIELRVENTATDLGYLTSRDTITINRTASMDELQATLSNIASDDLNVTCNMIISDPKGEVTSVMATLYDSTDVSTGVVKAVQVYDTHIALVAPNDGDFYIKLEVSTNTSNDKTIDSPVIYGVHEKVIPTVTIDNTSVNDLDIEVDFTVTDVDGTMINGSIELVDNTGSSLTPVVTQTIAVGDTKKIITCPTYGDYMVKIIIDSSKGATPPVLSPVINVASHRLPVITFDTSTFIINDLAVTVDISANAVDPDGLFTGPGTLELIDRNGLTTNIHQDINSINDILQLSAILDGDYTVRMTLPTGLGDVVADSNVITLIAPTPIADTITKPAVSFISGTRDINVSGIIFDSTQDPNKSEILDIELLDAVGVPLSPVVSLQVTAQSGSTVNDVTLSAPSAGDYTVRVTSNVDATVTSELSDIVTVVPLPYTVLKPVGAVSGLNDIRVTNIGVVDPDGVYTDTDIIIDVLDSAGQPLVPALSVQRDKTLTEYTFTGVEDNKDYIISVTAGTESELSDQFNVPKIPLPTFSNISVTNTPNTNDIVVDNVAITDPNDTTKTFDVIIEILDSGTLSSLVPPVTKTVSAVVADGNTIPAETLTVPTHGKYKAVAYLAVDHTDRSTESSEIEITTNDTHITKPNGVYNTGRTITVEGLTYKHSTDATSTDTIVVELLDELGQPLVPAVTVEHAVTSHIPVPEFTMTAPTFGHYTLKAVSKTDPAIESPLSAVFEVPKIPQTLTTPLLAIENGDDVRVSNISVSDPDGAYTDPNVVIELYDVHGDLSNPMYTVTQDKTLPDYLFTDVETDKEYMCIVLAGNVSETSSTLLVPVVIPPAFTGTMSIGHVDNTYDITVDGIAITNPNDHTATTDVVIEIEESNSGNKLTKTVTGVVMDGIKIPMETITVPATGTYTAKAYLESDNTIEGVASGYVLLVQPVPTITAPVIARSGTGNDIDVTGIIYNNLDEDDAFTEDIEIELLEEVGTALTPNVVKVITATNRVEIPSTVLTAPGGGKYIVEARSATNGSVKAPNSNVISFGIEFTGIPLITNSAGTRTLDMNGLSVLNTDDNTEVDDVIVVVTEHNTLATFEHTISDVTLDGALIPIESILTTVDGVYSVKAHLAGDITVESLPSNQVTVTGTPPTISTPTVAVGTNPDDVVVTGITYEDVNALDTDTEDLTIELLDDAGAVLSPEVKVTVTSTNKVEVDPQTLKAPVSGDYTVRVTGTTDTSLVSTSNTITITIPLPTITKPTLAVGTFPANIDVTTVTYEDTTALDTATEDLVIELLDDAGASLTPAVTSTVTATNKVALATQTLTAPASGDYTVKVTSSTDGTVMSVLSDVITVTIPVATISTPTIAAGTGAGEIDVTTVTYENLNVADTATEDLIIELLDDAGASLTPAITLTVTATNKTALATQTLTATADGSYQVKVTSSTDGTVVSAVSNTLAVTV